MNYFLEEVVDFFGIGVVNATLFHREDNGNYFYVGDIGTKYLVESIDKSFYICNAFSGDI